MKTKNESGLTAGPGLCLIGTGAVATDHMKAFAGLGLDDRRWVVSRRPEAAEDFAREWQFEHWGIDPKEALDDPDVELVVVASPSPVHAEQAAMALRAQKDVIVEIPAGLNLSEIEELARSAGGNAGRLFVCHTMRSFPAVAEIRRRVETGEFEATQVTGFFAIPRRNNQGWTGPRSWADDLFWHHACHQVDTTLWVLGVDTISSPYVLFGQRHPDFGMVMDLSLGFSCGGDVVVTHSLTYNSDRLLWELRFAGRQDVVVFRNGVLLDEAGAEITPEHSIRDLSFQDAEMLEARATGRPSVFDISAVMPTYRALHEIGQRAVAAR